MIPPRYTPENDRRAKLPFKVTRNVILRHIATGTGIALLTWAVTSGKLSYDRSLADPPLLQSRFIAESLARHNQRAEYFAQVRLDSVISAGRDQRINARFDGIEHDIACLRRPHSVGC